VGDGIQFNGVGIRRRSSRLRREVGDGSDERARVASESSEGGSTCVRAAWAAAMAAVAQLGRPKIEVRAGLQEREGETGRLNGPAS
jgi:hypothetical protein